MGVQKILLTTINNSIEYEKITFVTDAASVNKIVANLESEDIKIVPGDGEAIKLTYYDIPEDEIYSVTDNNGDAIVVDINDIDFDFIFEHNSH